MQVAIQQQRPASALEAVRLANSVKAEIDQQMQGLVPKKQPVTPVRPTGGAADPAAKAPASMQEAVFQAAGLSL